MKKKLGALMIAVMVGTTIGSAFTGVKPAKAEVSGIGISKESFKKHLENNFVNSHNKPYTYDDLKAAVTAANIPCSEDTNHNWIINDATIDDPDTMNKTTVTGNVICEHCGKTVHVEATKEYITVNPTFTQKGSYSTPCTLVVTWGSKKIVDLKNTPVYQEKPMKQGLPTVVQNDGYKVTQGKTVQSVSPSIKNTSKDPIQYELNGKKVGEIAAGQSANVKAGTYKICYLGNTWPDRKTVTLKQPDITLVSSVDKLVIGGKGVSIGTNLGNAKIVSVSGLSAGNVVLKNGVLSVKNFVPTKKTKPSITVNLDINGIKKSVKVNTLEMKMPSSAKISVKTKKIDYQYRVTLNYNFKKIKGVKKINYKLKFIPAKSPEKDHDYYGKTKENMKKIFKKLSKSKPIWNGKDFLLPLKSKVVIEYQIEYQGGICSNWKKLNIKC